MPVAILGHRGASALAVENTLEAFELALDRGADGVELDVQLSADGVVVVFHDETLDRLAADERGPVRERTWAELSALRLRHGSAIPRLADVVARLPARSIINVELKSFGDPEADRGLCRAVAPLVAGREHTICSSFDPDIVRGLVELQLPEPTLIVEALSPLASPQGLSELGARGLHLWDRLVEPELVVGLRNAGMAVGVWTVNDRARRRVLADLGVTRIITDDP